MMHMGVLGCKANFGLVDRREGYKRAGSAWLGALEGHQTAIGWSFVDSVSYSDCAGRSRRSKDSHRRGGNG